MWQSRLDTSNTIFALASGKLPSAIAIVRVSGSESFALTEKIFISHGEPFFRRRGLWSGVLRDLSGNFIDDIVVLSFVGPSSATGEDTVEFHCHGSISIVRRLESLLRELGARPAERGEFSYRSYLYGKLSASELELLGDVFLAQQPADLDRLYRRKDGSLEASIAILRDHLLRLQAILDTAVDFSEEYSAVTTSAREPLAVLIRECSSIIHRYSAFQQGVSAPKVVLAGRPNAGKSSLFNALLCRYRAIVDAEPGTTRDVIEEDIAIHGKTWRIVDTAGVRSEVAGEAEREGIALGEEFLGASSFWMLVVDGTVGLKEAESRLLDRFGEIPHLVVWNKNDLNPRSDTLSVSARTGQGIAELADRLKQELSALATQDSSPLPSATQSSRLEQVLRELEQMRADFDRGAPPEFLAEKNRRAISLLESVIGEVTVDDVLDRVFREFCIGK